VGRQSRRRHRDQDRALNHYPVTCHGGPNRPALFHWREARPDKGLPLTSRASARV
jgi:hypothetical protein